MTHQTHFVGEDLVLLVIPALIKPFKSFKLFELLADVSQCLEQGLA